MILMSVRLRQLVKSGFLASMTVAVASTLTMTFAPAAGAAPDPTFECRAANPADAAILAKVQSDVVYYLTQNNTPTNLKNPNLLSGLSFAIVSPGKTTIINCGVTAVGGSLPVDSKTIWEIGSETKMFTATALAQMVLSKKVGLDDPLAGYFPPGTPLPTNTCQNPNPKPITLRMLATHNAGLPTSPKNVTWNSSKPQGRSNYTRADLYASFSTGFAKPCNALMTTPGTAYFYSDWGFAMLGTALADKYSPGQTVPPFGQMVKDLVTGPLGMTSTFLETTTLPLGTAVPPCLPPLATPCYWNNNNAWAGGGGMLSTVGDMATFVGANLGFQKQAGVYPALQLTQRPWGFGPQCASAPTCEGLAWDAAPIGTGENPSPLFVTLNKDGGTNGFHSNTFIMPAACWGVTFLSNSASNVATLLNGGVAGPVIRKLQPNKSLC